MTIFNWLTIILWLILIAYWFISAFGAKKTVRTGSWWQRELGIRAILIVVFLLLVRLGVFRQGTLNFFHTSVMAPVINILLGIIGIICCAAGVALAIWARVHLGRNWGMPMTLREDPQLVTSGPYARVRHPIYTGFLLVMFGSIFTISSIWLIVLVVFGIYFIYSARMEEKIMTKQFPNEYPAYMKKTKMIIPFVF